MIHGLLSRPEKNGLEGKVLGFDAKTGRVRVKMQRTGEVLCVKPENLYQKAISCAEDGSNLSREEVVNLRWGTYIDGGEDRLEVKNVVSIVVFRGWICCGCDERSSWNGSGETIGSLLRDTKGLLKFYNKSTLDFERTIFMVEKIVALASCDGGLICADRDAVKVWDVASGLCTRTIHIHQMQTFIGHIAVVDSRVLIVSEKDIHVYNMTAGDTTWPLERTISETESVYPAQPGFLAVSGGFVIRASAANLMVRCLETGNLERRLEGHGDLISAIAAHESRVYSAAMNGELFMWEVGSWSLLRRLACGWREVAGAVLPLGFEVFYFCSLTVSGSKLVGATHADVPYISSQRSEVRVWDLGTLQCESVMKQTVSKSVRSLVSEPGAVWGFAATPIAHTHDERTELVVWRRR